MATASFTPRLQYCTSCCRRGLENFAGSTTFVRQQTRGKKALAKATTIKVRLLRDVPRYGRKGAIIPIAAGRMRNEFYPKTLAEYVTKAQIRDLGLESAVLERDPYFGMAQPKTAAEREVERAREIEVPERPLRLEMLKPDRARDVLDTLLPSNIDFYRQPISTNTAPARHSPSVPVTSAVSEAALEVALSSGPQKVGIYGSVSTADIVSSIKALLAEDDEGARVVLSTEDISIVEVGEEQDRVKHLGKFDIDIQIKGATTDIRRTVTINAQD